VKNANTSNIKYFTVMNAHLRPKAAYQELIDMRRVIFDFILRNPEYFGDTVSSLIDVITDNVIDANIDVKPNMRTNHPILIIGDLNADCAYISQTRQRSLR
jgi:hypothetical protein